jgi:hypothetical protein
LFVSGPQLLDWSAIHLVGETRHYDGCMPKLIPSLQNIAA